MEYLAKGIKEPKYLVHGKDFNNFKKACVYAKGLSSSETLACVTDFNYNNLKTYKNGKRLK